MASTSGIAAKPTSAIIPGLAIGFTLRSAGLGPSHSSIWSGTRGICVLPESTFSATQARPSARYRWNFRVRGRLHSTQWASSAPHGISLTGYGCSQLNGELLLAIMHAAALDTFALAIALVFVLVGAATMYSFLNTPLQPLEPAGAAMESASCGNVRGRSRQDWNLATWHQLQKLLSSAVV